MNTLTTWRALALALTILGTLAAGTADAIDGVVLIDQSRVLASGGFPYTISQPGSYRLAGNLTVPSSATAAIVIAVQNVSVDLNGFAIVGPALCQPSAVIPNFISCSNLGAGGAGIAANLGLSGLDPNGGLSIENGTIQGMGGFGVLVNTRGHTTVRNLRLIGNGAFGISASRVTMDRVHASENGGPGIAVSFGVLTNSLSVSNGGDGIVASHSLLIGNAAFFNDRAGIAGSGVSSLAHNLMQGNRLGDFGGSPLTVVQTAGNTCSDQLCP